MNEKELLRKIKDDADQISPPDSLSPDAIEQLLRGMQMRADDSGCVSGSKETPGQMQSSSEAWASEDVSVNTSPERSFQTGKASRSQALQTDTISQAQERQAGKIPRSQTSQADNVSQSRTSEGSFSSQSQDGIKAHTPRHTASERSTDMKNPSKKMHRFLPRLRAAAAVFVLAFLVVALAGRITRKNDSSESSTVQTESDGILTASLTNDNDGAVANDAYDSGSTNAENEAADGSDSADAAAEITESSDNINSEYEATGTDSDSAEAETEIINADDTSAIATVSTGTMTSADAADPFTYASSYEEIYEAISALYSDIDMAIGATADYDGASASSNISSFSARSGSSSATSEAAENGVMTIEDSMEDAADTGTSDDSDYSTTNIQEAGVDEADIVKTDGTYIYILRTSGEFLIVRVGDEMELVSQTAIESDNDLNALELYLDGDTLSVITSEYATSLESTDDGIYYTYSSEITALYTWDISDRAEPALTGRVTQEGYYSDSRKVGDYIYLFTGWYPTIGTSYAESTITPLLNGKAADAESYYLPETLTDSECLIISSVNITSPSEFADNKILVSGAQDFYVSQENIYIMNQSYQSQTVTEITKFHYEDGQITGVAAGTVTGYLNDSFSMNEYNGYLRLVTTYYGDNVSPTATVTDWTEHNALFILGETLNQVSVIADLAEGETIRSARFLGDTGYFVTFRQTDPLFSVDLSDPENPQILGELKISGFSTYLHFYGENLLLGLGYEADESTGTTTGLKLSMFDISDPSSVTEVGKYVISGVTWCASLNEYKSILVDASKNLIGFYCDDRYLLFSYDEENGFVQELIYDFYSDQLVGEANAYTMRGLYIGDDFYLAGSSFVIRFDMSDDFAKTEVLTLE